MTQERLKSLVLEIADELNDIKAFKVLLDIALEQGDINNPKALERMNLLLDVFISRLDCSIDDMNSTIRKLRKEASCLADIE